MDTQTFIDTYQSQVNGNNKFLFFAPGRVNLMGEHTDYTGGSVLPSAISLGTYLFVQLIPENKIKLHSLNLDSQEIISLDEIQHPRKKWTDYPIGVLHELALHGWEKTGLELTYFGDMPLNAGLSSSASIELVTAFALNAIFSLGLSDKELALLAQRAERDFAGVQCGIMDQYSIAMARPEHALLLDCHELVHSYIPIRFTDYRFVVVNSNVKRALVNSGYNERVKELQQVLNVINSFFEVPYLGMLSGEDHEWLDKLVEDELLKKRLRHIVNENTRVKVAAELLEKNNVSAFGQLMYDSHDSLRYDFEVSCPELDILVATASTIEGVAGSRMTGAGFGGCTLHLVHQESIENFTKNIISQYKKKTNILPSVFVLLLNGKKKQLS